MSRVSIVMPLYNAENYVKDTLDSLINQTYKDFEIIVIEDASLDNSLNIVKNYQDERIRIYKNENNQGIAYSRNRGLELCTGEYIALMDNDDLAPIQRIAHEVEYLDKNRDIDVVCGHYREIDENGIDLGKQWNAYANPKYTRACLLFQDAVPNSSAMFRRSFIEMHGIRYQDAMYGAEDYRFWVNCSLHGWIGGLDEVLLYWRNRKDNETAHVLKDKAEERREAIAEIQRYALSSHGFLLNKNEIRILNKVFMESGTVDSNSEIEELYLALKEIARQAQELNLNHAREIVTMCRKRFGEKVGKAFYLW